MSDMKIVKVRFYDEMGRVAENGKFAYMTFQICKGDEPDEGDFLVQVTNLKGIPVIVATYIIDEHGRGFGEPKDVNNLDELKKLGIPEEIIAEIRDACKARGIDWI